MIIVRKDQSIKRRGTVGKVMTYAGLAIMAIAFLISLRETENFTSIFIVVLLGLTISQIGIPIFNRYGREPRVDQILDQSLKGLDDRYVLIHYLLGADHALLSPAGAFALIPALEKGAIRLQDGDWIQTIATKKRERRKLLKSLGKSGRSETDRMQRSLKKLLDDETQITVAPLYVFMHSGATISSGETDVFATHIKKIKSDLRKAQKRNPIPSFVPQRILQHFPADHG
jgi:hypothetical protein